MTDQDKRMLRNVAASSAMEGLPLSQEQLRIVEKLLDGEMTLQEYLQSIRRSATECGSESVTNENGIF